jgi:hypothetical protein
MLGKTMLTIFTIVLNGMPFIERHLAEFKKLKIPWQWRIVEGVSEPLGCTRWCKQVPDKWHKNFVSIDGTHEYLQGIQGDNVVVHSQANPFPGKLTMINEALRGVDSGVVMEIDADEMWKADQIEKIYECLKGCEEGRAMQFHCNYYVGQNKKVVTREGFASHWYEWLRAWKWGRGCSLYQPRTTQAECPVDDDSKGSDRNLGANLRSLRLRHKGAGTIQRRFLWV